MIKLSGSQQIENKVKQLKLVSERLKYNHLICVLCFQCDRNWSFHFLLSSDGRMKPRVALGLFFFSICAEKDLKL